MPAKPNEIQIIRVYDAPLKLVWEAWTDLNHISKWWGPRGFTLTTKSKELRPGGKWIYTMHGPDGTDYPNIATYHEVVPYEKLVYDHGATEEREKLFTVTVTFKEENGKTVMNMISAFSSAEMAKTMKVFIKNANGTSTWDRLGEYLVEEWGGSEAFMITRSFHAPIKDVFAKWVDPNEFMRWLGPSGSSMKFLQADIRENGSSLWEMLMPDGQTKYGKLKHKTIRPHSLLVYLQHFCERSGELVKPSFAPTYPDMLQTTVTFVEEEAHEGLRETRVSVRWDIAGPATAAERQTFLGMRAGMTEGWNGSFDKLETLLEHHSPKIK